MTASPTGFDLTLVGFSTPRDMANAAIRLTPAPGSNLQTTEFTVNLANFFAEYYASSAAAPFGSQFRLVIPFRIDGAAALPPHSVTLSNSAGASAPSQAPASLAISCPGAYKNSACCRPGSTVARAALRHTVPAGEW